MTTFTTKLVLLLPFLLCACTGAPFMEVDLGYTINQTTDHNKVKVATDRCDYAATIRAGAEYKNGVTAGYAHDSFLDCGAPFNDIPEFHRDYIYVGYKIGGR